MKLLAVFLCGALILLIAGVVFRRKRARSVIPAYLSLKELIDRALVAVKSLDSEMDGLKESFRPSAYIGIGRPISWTPAVCERLLERLEHVKMCLSRMESNVLTFDELGSLSVLFTMGEDKLAQEIVTKAAECKAELKQLKWRIKVYDLVPILMWRMLGKGIAQSCLNVGNDLIQQYELLGDRVLGFIRARGESYQSESLLSAL